MSGCRHATWNGRLSDDAFAEDTMVDNLLTLHVERRLNKALTPPALNPTSNSGLNPSPGRGPSFEAAAAAAGIATPQQLQASSHPTAAAAPVIIAGAGAAAVEAAVAAINAAIAGNTMQRKQQQQQQQQGAAAGAEGSTRSFYRALMETGGILNPPGGPPIPLNVDFAREIQPHLGKLLGRGGFGAVYEATWRSHKVRMLQYFWLQSFY
jgi:hypothetical protein